MPSFWQRHFGAAEPAAKPKAPGVRAPAQKPRAATPDAAPPPSATPAEISERFHRHLFALPAAVGGSPSSSGRAMLKRLEMLSTRFDVRSLPRLPAVLPQLLRVLKSDTAAGAELAKLVGRDPLMVGEVMRVTGSVYYRTAQPIGSLRQAVILLGQEGLHRVVTQLAMMPILQASTGSSTLAGEWLWAHAERCAHACAWLGKTQGGDGFESYLAGIVSHSGSGAVVRLLRQLLTEAPSPEALDSDFIAACASLGSRLSLQAACYWELPERVVAALDENQHEGSIPESGLGRSLMAANILAMGCMLAEQGLIPPDADLSGTWPGTFAPAVIKRCQANLVQHFQEERQEAEET